MTLLVENRALLDAFRAGDSRALRQIFLHYGPYLARMLRRGFGFAVAGRAMRFTGYEGIFDLEDTLQEIFQRAFSERARLAYDGLRPYRAYLTTIARNAVINDYVSRKRALERFVVEHTEDADEGEWSAGDDPLFIGPAPPTGHPERDAQSAELRALVAQFKAGLAAREREVFGLRFEDGLSHIEITARTSISPSKIKTAEAHIRKQMQSFLRRHGYLVGRRSGHAAAHRTVPEGETG